MKLEFSDALLLFLYCTGTYQHTFKSASNDAFFETIFFLTKYLKIKPIISHGKGYLN